MAINQDIQSRVDAYMGNPEALAQKYQQNQQLIDLLALQKIKSEKEAAARQMQMQMAQKQAASGESAMTVAQQREKEVLDLTKNELVGQQSKLLQQEQGEQQAAMQKLLSGIAAAPGAQNAAAPQAMAAGGIVAFAEGGSARTPRRGYIIDPETGEERPMTIRELHNAGQASSPEATPSPEPASETESTAGMMLRSVGEMFAPSDSKAPEYRKEDRQYAQREEGIRKAKRAVTPGLFEQLHPETRGIMAQHKRFYEDLQRPTAATPAPAPTLGTGYRDESREDRRVGPVAAGGNPPPPTARRAAAPTGIAAAMPPATTPAPSVAMPTGLEAAITGALGMDLDATQDAQQKRAQAAFGMSPEEKALIASNRAKTAEMTAARFDPKKQRDERLTQFLLGMGGQSTGLGALGAGGTSAVNYRRMMEDAEGNEQLGLMKLREADLEKERGIRGEAYKGGLEGRKQDSQLKQQGMVSGASVFSTAQTAQTALTRLASENRWKDLEAETAKATARATQAAAAASREDNAANRYNANVTRVLAEIANATNDVAKMYKDRFGLLDNQNPSDPKVKQARQDLMTQYENEVEQRTKALKDQAKRLDEGYFSGGARGAGGAANTGAGRVTGSRPAGGQ